MHFFITGASFRKGVRNPLIPTPNPITKNKIPTMSNGMNSVFHYLKIVCFSYYFSLIHLIQFRKVETPYLKIVSVVLPDLVHVPDYVLHTLHHSKCHYLNNR